MYLLRREAVAGLMAALHAKQWTVFAQGEDSLNYKELAEGMVPDMGWDNRPTNISAKELVFPQKEPLFFFRKTVDGVSVADAKIPEHNTVLFGAKPCDAASFEILAKVFNWDYKDEFFNTRMAHLTVIGMACDYSDAQCFCTSVGLSQQSQKGSDIFLRPLTNSDFEAAVLTPKGERFVQEFASFFSEQMAPSEYRPHRAPAPKVQFSTEDVKQFLDANFEHPIWSEAGETCLGCAQCAYSCPVCHCFDIVDETCTVDCGRRMKNWDACQFSSFTRHASGHNPRDNQNRRYRQRVSHKFKYYQDKFGETLCTGCGRCARGCPVGIAIADVVSSIAQLANPHMQM
jgi:ferredoxin